MVHLLLCRSSLFFLPWQIWGPTHPVHPQKLWPSGIAFWRTYAGDMLVKHRNTSAWEVKKIWRALPKVKQVLTFAPSSRIITMKECKRYECQMTKKVTEVITADNRWSTQFRMWKADMQVLTQICLPGKELWSQKEAIDSTNTFLERQRDGRMSVFSKARVWVESENRRAVYTLYKN